MARLVRMAACAVSAVLAIEVSAAKPLRPAANYQTTTAQFTLNLASDEGDYIGQGERHNFGESDTGIAHVRVVSVEGIGPVRIEVYFDEVDDLEGSWISMDFGAPAGQPLTVGTYEDAERLAFASPGKPGISIFMDHRGCNTILGRFVISTLEFDCLGEEVHLKQFAIRFEQHCEGGEPMLEGELTLTDEGGVTCGSETPGGGGGPTPPPPPPPPNVSIHLPTYILEQPIALDSDGSVSFEISTSTLPAFSGDVHLSIIGNGREGTGLDLLVDPALIAAPGNGTATVHIKASPNTFPRDYWVNVMATTADERVYASPTIHVTVLCDPPMVLGTDQPRSQTVAPNASGSLSVRATGSGPFSYQWYRGNRGATRFPIGGATSSTLNDAQPGPYWVRVSNPCGSTDSSTATVRR